MSSNKRFTYLAILVAMLVFGVAVFGSSPASARFASQALAQADYGSPTPGGGATTPTVPIGSAAHVRIMNAALDAGDLDVFADGSKIASSLGYGQYSELLTVGAGAHVFNLAPGSAAAIITQTATLAVGMEYTIVAIGSKAKADYAALVEQTDLSPLPAGKTRLRVTHAADGVDNFDFYINGSKLISNLAYSKASDYLEMDSVTANIEIKLAGSNTTIASVPGLYLQPGHVFQLIAIGLVNDNQNPFGPLTINELASATTPTDTPVAPLVTTTPGPAATPALTSTAVLTPTAPPANPTAVLTPTARPASPTAVPPTATTARPTPTAAPVRQPTATPGTTPIGMPNTGQGDGGAIIWLIALLGFVLIGGGAAIRRPRRT